MYCKNCGSYIGQNGTFCGKCGHSAAKKDNAVLYIVIASVLLVAVIGGIWYALSRNDNQAPASSVMPSPAYSVLPSPSIVPSDTPSPSPTTEAFMFSCDGIIINNTLPYGKKYMIRGTISANQVIKDVNVIVLDDSMNREIDTSISNDSNVFNMSKIDESIYINKLTRGSKVFEIWVTHPAGKKKVFEQHFDII